MFDWIDEVFSNRTALVFVGIYAIVASLGLFDIASVDPTVKLFAFLPLSIFAAIYWIGYIRRKAPSIIDRLAFGLFAVILLKVTFLYLAGRGLDSFPMDVFLLVALATIHPLPLSITYTASVVLLNLARSYTGGEELSQQDAIYRITALIFTVIVVGVLLLRERRARTKAEGRWEGVESLATNIAGNEEMRNGAAPAVLKNEKERVALNSAFELNNSLNSTLETIGAITGAYSSCLFVPDGETFKLSPVISRSRGLIYSIPRGKGKNLVNWIEEHNRPLNKEDVRDFATLGYYSSDAGMRQFLGVPVTAGSGAIRAILTVDRKEPVFTKEEERLLTLAAAAISVFLENSAIINQMRVEGREFSAFYRLTTMLSKTLKQQEILDMGIGFSKEVIDYDVAAIALKDENGVLKFVAARGDKSSAMLNGNVGRGLEFFQWVMDKGIQVPYYGERLKKNIANKLPQPFERMGSLLCAPLAVGDRVMGVIITARSQDTPYSTYEMKLFEAISAHLSVAVSNSAIYGKMEELATRDGLTGLHNFRFFHERLSHEMERGGRYNQPLALILLDIDFFKKVNDSYGHPAGDKVLKGVAAILAANTRDIDLAARYGGEEFVLILINTDAKGAMVIAERVRAGIEKALFDIGEGKTLRITSSMGISIFPSDANDQRLMISKADSALYLAKKEGRNRVYLFNEVSSRIEAKKK